MTQLAQCFRFDLSNALARHVEVLTNFFQGPLVTTVVETETQPNHTFFTRAQGLQHVACDLTQIRGDDSRCRALARLVFDQVAQLRVAVLTNRRLEGNRTLHQLTRLENLVYRSIHLLRDLFSRRFTAKLADQLTRSVL